MGRLLNYITICDTENCPHELVCERKSQKSNDKRPGFKFKFEVNNGRFECLNERVIIDV